jgi:hypothetical protein
VPYDEVGELTVMSAYACRPPSYGFRAVNVIVAGIGSQVPADVDM